MDKEWLVHTVTPEEAGRRIESLLRGRLGCSRRMLQRLTRTNGFTLNGKKARLAQPVQTGDILKVCIHRPETGDLAPVAMSLDIVYEDGDLLVVNKPPGLEVHPPEQKARFRPTLAHGIAHYFAASGYQARVRPVHRLDKDTSGLVVFAKNVYTHQVLDRQLRAGKLRRGYLAVVRGVPPANTGTLDFPIGRDPHHPVRRLVREDGEPAITHYTVLRVPAGDLALVRLELTTGRTHQIRVHLSQIGCPVLGDRLYGGHSPLIGRQALHAWSVAFLPPRSGEQVLVRQSLPADMLRLLT
ncbi:MAG: RluA family pseudouridine synthase [Heliobacteriaceae bacterium]|nr:RluA family pseudouridine synthase [Heliobacteriaceae bacterium]MDD4588376.1 RluA family pseudouridine synthase [Heliobacteriaceae bacterium]